MTSEHIDLSIVIETATNEITGRNRLGQNLQDWLRQAEKIAPRSFEILVCAPEMRVSENPSPRLSFVIEPGAGYYALKNAGANRAKGRIVFFGDADCRPCDGFFLKLLEAFDSGLSDCWAGRSFYDGNDFLTRLNTATSFGYIHERDNQYPLPVLGHNLSLLRACYERDPFGPYPGRSGGDVFFALTMRQRHRPFRLCENAVTYHENLSYSIRATIDRHMAEHFSHVLLFRQIPDNLPMLAVIKQAFHSLRSRLDAAQRHGAKFNLKTWQRPLILAILSFYTLLDAAVATMIVAVPPWRNRWLRYQFGLEEDQLFRFLKSPTHSQLLAGL